MTPQQRALEIIVNLRSARLDYAHAVLAQAEAENKLALVKAQAEDRVIAMAGAEKALGANQAARERTLTLATASDEDLQDAKIDYQLAYLHRQYMAAMVKALEEELRVLLAFAGETVERSED
jgi:tryptophan 2,3-dioxygenase